MKRIDSGFQESFFLQAKHNEPPATIVRSNTAPSRRRKPQNSLVDTTASASPTDMNSQRPESEKRSRPAHQRSKTSSSETSTTRSKGRNHTSKPSSRRNSCTIVDPSRSRHYRMQSSHTVPTVNSQDIDDVYALHHRSYNMFQNPSLHTSSGLPSPTSRIGHSEIPSSTSRFSAEEPICNDQDDHPKQSEDTIVAAPMPSPPMQWTSPCTRRREYERIDRANSGVRGFLNKVMPRCVSGPQEKFYKKDQSDTGSVRRYRLDDEDNVAVEKELARSQTHTLRKPTGTNKKKWICF
ncbi:hypothetical protein DE146DRAFT_343077 [Phaeosphaeria sp. MPI-PUGE-AT-0046c]|nr:hypothetical protein DE146DRAFT_343077 [Phaeosphaeria sp. MPI-PUGE-AT-0046c]